MNDRDVVYTQMGGKLESPIQSLEPQPEREAAAVAHMARLLREAFVTEGFSDETAVYFCSQVLPKLI